MTNLVAPVTSHNRVRDLTLAHTVCGEVEKWQQSFITACVETRREHGRHLPMCEKLRQIRPEFVVIQCTTAGVSASSSSQPRPM